MVKLIMVWLFGAAVFTLGNVYAASSDRPTDEKAIGAQVKITLIQAILDEDEDEDLQDDEELQEDEEDTGDEGDSQDDLEDEEGLEDEDDQEDSSRRQTTPI